MYTSLTYVFPFTVYEIPTLVLIKILEKTLISLSVLCGSVHTVMVKESQSKNYKE